jgi:2-polyprenyl-3-methyl-5-hydroxy-6-metoxy-1,4-benzoquinol methylase
MQGAGEGGCRFCGAPLQHVFCDLGMSPIANSYPTPDRLGQMEPFYPLRCLVCEQCFLVQLEEYESPQQIFSDYAYFSSYSSSWVQHARDYVEMAVDRFELGPENHVVEIASNDGYLLQWFVERGIPVLGVEPAGNVAEVAEQNGVRSLVKFFGQATAREVAAMFQADLLLGNNVLAHVPDLNDFVAGMKILLAPGGTLTMEFPHLLRLIEENEWDTIYHEHFSYFSWITVAQVFARHGLRLYDVEEIPTHGGSLRIFGCHADAPFENTGATRELEQRERDAGLDQVGTYLSFERRVREHKWQIVDFLIDQARAGKRIAAYGAPAKGNTLLNYCGIGTDLIEFTCDLNPVKQGRYLPGTHIPIKSPDAIREEQPDLVLILPWNLEREIAEQLSYVRDWGGRLAVPAPEVRVLE